MLILRNWADGTTPIMHPDQSDVWPQETKVVGEEMWIRALSASGLSTYGGLLANQSATIWTHSVEINPEVDCMVSQSSAGATEFFCPANQWTKLSITRHQSLEPNSFSRAYAIECNDATLKDKWIRTRLPMSNEGEQSSDLYVPPENFLTAGQQATLPPYGEFKEILPFLEPTRK